jgi:RNA polymerase sigma factor (sigma-70 family)
MNTTIYVEDFDLVDKIIQQAAQKLWKKSYKTCWHVFSSFEDSTQVAWTALCSSRKSQEILAQSIKGKEGLINTIAYRGMVDYIRSVIGRKDKPNSDRSLQLFRTTRYMDFYKSDKYGHEYNPEDLLDIIMPQKECEDPESLLIASTMQKEIDIFLNSKLSRKDKMIMDYIHKKDLTMKEVGKKFAITESRVSQIKAKAIKLAQEKFANDI